MRSPRISRSLAVLAMLACGAAFAAAPTQFSAAAGEIRDIAVINATTAYAATQGGGVWKTTNTGAAWTKTSLPARYVWKVAANPASAGARLYAATDVGLFRSIDSGATWTQLTQDPTRAVAVSPTSAGAGPDTVLVGVRGVGILRTTDSGATFTRQSTGLDSTDVLTLAFYPSSGTVAVAVLQCNIEDAPNLRGNWGGVFRSSNVTSSPVNWAPLNGTGLGALPGVGSSTRPCVNAFAINGTAGTPLLVAGIKDPLTTQGATYTFNNATSNWAISAGGGLPYGVEYLAPDISNASGFLLGSYQFGIFRSSDGGANFSQLYTGSDPELQSQAFGVGAFTSSIAMAGVGGLGLMITTDTGASWNLPATPIRADRVNDLTNHETAAAGTYYMALKSGGVMKSLNAGTNWAQFNAGLNTVFGATGTRFIWNVESIGAHPGNTSVVALGIHPNGLYQLAGASWSPVAGYVAAQDHKPQGITITGTSLVYYSLMDPGANTPGGLHKSIATGSTIGTMASADYPRYNDALANTPSNIAQGAWRVRSTPNALFLVMYDSLPYRSTDGTNWNRVATVDSGFQRHAFFDMTAKPGTPSVLVASTNKGIYRTGDSGANWFRLAISGLNQTALAALTYAPNGVIFGGDLGGQLWCSGDDGSTWIAVTGGALPAPVKDIKYMNGAVHVLTDGAGVWKKDQVCP